MPAMREVSSDRLGVVPNTAFWMACCSRLLSPSRPGGREHGVGAAGGGLHHAGDGGAALDVDVGKHGGRLRDAGEGLVSVLV